LAEDIINNPKKYGSKNIERAIKYLSAYFREPRGACTCEERFFRGDRGEHEDVFRVFLNRRAYDREVMINMGLEFKGIAIKENTILDPQKIESLEGKIDERVRSIYNLVIIVPKTKMVSIEEDVFQSRYVRLGLRLDNCSMKRDVGLANLILLRGEQDSRDDKEIVLLCKQDISEPVFKEEVRQDKITILSFDTNLNPKLSKMGSLYTCLIKRNDRLVDFVNAGPGYMPLFIKRYQVPD